jgi:hypothetical protein
MNIYQFMSESPILTFFLATIIIQGIIAIVIGLPNQFMKRLNIWKHGYPPVHCDADGDFRKLL